MKERKKISTGKFGLFAFLIICVEILIYTEVVMYKLSDLSALSVLIGIPVALSSALIGYYFKSTKENTEGGVVYATALHNLKQQAMFSTEAPVSAEDDSEDNAVG